MLQNARLSDLIQSDPLHLAKILMGQFAALATLLGSLNALVYLSHCGLDFPLNLIDRWWLMTG